MSNLLVLIVILPLTVAALIPILSLRFKNCAFRLTVLTSLFCFCSAFYFFAMARTIFPLTYYFGGWVPPLGIGLFLDELGCFFIILVSFIFLAVVLVSHFQLELKIDSQGISPFYSLLLLLLTGMLGFILAADIFNMFVFFEIFSLSSYALVATPKSLGALRASFKYLLMGTISMLFFLLGIALLYSLTGVLHIPLISQKLAGIAHTQPVQVALVLVLIAFGIEAALFPLSTWLPQAHALAPSLVSALLSALVIKMGILGLIKVLYYIFGYPLKEALLLVFVVMAVLSVFLGAFFAFKENDIKLVLAHSSVSQIGYIVLGITLCSYFSLVGGLFQILSHALAKAILFLCVGVILSQTGFRRLEDLKGIARQAPLLMGFFGIALASLASLPLTGGFVAKYYLCRGAVEKGEFWIAGAILLGGLLTIFYCLKIFSFLFIFAPVRKFNLKISPWVAAPIGGLAAISLLLGIFPMLAFTLIGPAVDGLLKAVK